MKKFWPNRSKAKGFSIKNIAHKYRFNVCGLRSLKDVHSNKLLDDRDKIFLKEGIENNSIHNLSIKRMHWANRDFSEYKKAA
tara:strand:- start:652 stop:897 length:246 start_codon:yes stop_codon:yes gene_type:complete